MGHATKPSSFASKPKKPSFLPARCALPGRAELLLTHKRQLERPFLRTFHDLLHSRNFTMSAQGDACANHTFLVCPPYQPALLLADKFQYYISQIDKELSKYPALNKLEAQTQVPKAYGVLAVGTIFSSFIFFNIFASFLSNLLGWAVPAYLSLKALETPGHDDDTQWLTYWVIFGGFNFLESMSSVLVKWFPYYFTFKTVFILYLILPSTRGASVVYAKVFKPLASQKTTSAPVTSTPVPSQ